MEIYADRSEASLSRLTATNPASTIASDGAIIPAGIRRLRKTIIRRFTRSRLIAVVANQMPAVGGKGWTRNNFQT
jgi:hypothetical protein